MNADILNDLAARVEALDGQNRAIEYEIADAILGPMKPPYRRGYVQAFTASTDAAMSLAIPGWWWSTGQCSVSSDATVGPDVAHCCKEMLIKYDEGIEVIIEPPTSTAHALTAAWLRAHAAIAKENDGG